MFFAAPAGVVKSIVIKDATNGAPQTVSKKTVYVKGANNYVARDKDYVYDTAKSTEDNPVYTKSTTDSVPANVDGGMAYDLFYVSNDNANRGDAKYNITVTKN